MPLCCAWYERREKPLFHTMLHIFIFNRRSSMLTSATFYSSLFFCVSYTNNGDASQTNGCRRRRLHGAELLVRMKKLAHSCKSIKMGDKSRVEPAKGEKKSFNGWTFLSFISIVGWAAELPSSSRSFCLASDVCVSSSWSSNDNTRSRGCGGIGTEKKTRD